MAGILPLFGFYLQPAVGGRPLDYNFWRRFLGNRECRRRLKSLLSIATDDRRIARRRRERPRAGDSSLHWQRRQYRGRPGDPLSFPKRGRALRRGLLGQWAVWTKRAVELLEEIKCAKTHGRGIDALLARGAEITDANAALFDARMLFAAASPVSTKSCGDRGCSPAAGVSIRTKGFPMDSSRRSIAFARRIRI